MLDSTALTIPAFDEFARVPTTATLEYFATYTPSPSDPSLITFDNTSREFTVTGNNLALLGTYTVKVGANDFYGTDTGEWFEFDIDVTNPCESATFTIHDPTDVFKSPAYTYTLSEP